MADQDPAHTAFLVGAARGDIHDRHGKTRADGDEVAKQVAGRELVKEKQRNTTHGKQHSGNIGAGEPLAKHERRQNEDKHRRGELKHNRIGGGGQLVGGDERQEGQREKNAAHKRRTVHTHAQPGRAHIHNDTPR